MVEDKMYKMDLIFADTIYDARIHRAWRVVTGFQK